MLRGTHQRAWTKPLNWNLHATILFGETRTPFSLYVRAEPAGSQCQAFPQFLALPAELQLRVLGFCDPPTLFWLMQASPATRLEAEKLFWSHPDAWYSVECHWVLDGGFAGYAHLAPEFVARVERVEVDFADIEELWTDPVAQICGTASMALSHGRTERLRRFWQTLRRRLPRVTCVVISESRPRKARESLPQDLQALLQMCPSSISVLASLLFWDVPERRKSAERSLWRLAPTSAGTPGDWEEVNPVWTRQSILPPPKEFRGPVGAYERTRYKFLLYGLRRTAAQLLRLEARERHHFHGRREPFGCPYPGCEAWFNLPGEWTLHATYTRHDYEAVAPNAFKASFDQLEGDLERMLQQDIHGPKRTMLEDWGEEGSNKRQAAEQAFLHQLDFDPLYTHVKPARETLAWALYTEDMDPSSAS
ncbi:hypothetical protein BU26DRAFT_127725 [Trematosphaeria pertusa]|uniref:Uncharacterized protein n=1 Tax=Trematosphaeria pertusa TaxID=390896 RepID=A0A6A6HYS4_9PLEO|nr:uncharacterized protein BU26DRAFT_127725 [Trematosphaeria pertusa]KAF2243177.1 hypothetical protein BU26DRAFT_127725 [Trematosphaeria pertusa]